MIEILMYIDGNDIEFNTKIYIKLILYFMCNY